MRTLAGARYWLKKGNYNRAITFLDFESMAKIVMDGYWDDMSYEQKQKMISFMKNLIREKFPVITKRLKWLRFGKITMMGSTALCETVAVFDKTVENQDQKIHIGLKKQPNGTWKGVEVYIVMEGFLNGLNQDTVRPIMSNGGSIDQAMTAIRRVFEERQ
jgi:ABC-type transporter MlaC component